MAKKKKKQKRKKRAESKLAGLTVRQLEEKGRNLLQSGSYQQASQCFRKLLKEEENEAVRELLAEADRGRVARFVEKGLFKEALVLLNAMERDSVGSGLESLHIQLLLQTGKEGEAVTLYRQHLQKLGKSDLAFLERLIGASLLSGKGIRVEDLPGDVNLVKHYAPAEAAVAAYCRNDDVAVETALKEIPFRSPYKDLRLLLKGLVMHEDDPEQAKSFLDKIDSDSPYRQFAALLTLRSAPPAELLAVLKEASSQKRRHIQDVLALNKQKMSVLAGISEAATQPKRLAHVILAAGNCLPDNLKVRLIQRILPHCGYDVMALLERVRHFPEREMARLVALAAELSGEYEFAVEMWDDFLEVIDKSMPDYSLIRALVLRRQAKIMRRARWDFYPNEILKKLEKSLEYDPQDKDAWLLAIEVGRQMKTSKGYQLINRASEQFPEDADILLKMIEAAAERGAFKKASRYADKLLAIDPINTRAKDLLVEARLAHGRRLAARGKMELARREFEEAESKTRSARYQGRHLICLGLLSLLEKRADEGLDLIEQGRRLGAGRLSSLVLTAVEARLMQTAGKWYQDFVKEVRQAAAEKAEREEILRISGWIQTFTGNEWPALLETCGGLSKFFKQAADMMWSLEEGLLICRSLIKAKLFFPLEKVADSLRRKWPDHPELVYCRIYAKTGRANNKIGQEDIDQLVKARDTAYDQQNYLLGDEIGVILMELRRVPETPSDFDEFINDLLDFSEEEDDDPFEPLFKLPSKPAREKKKKKAGAAPRQLNLFDLEQDETE